MQWAWNVDTGMGGNEVVNDTGVCVRVCVCVCVTLALSMLHGRKDLLIGSYMYATPKSSPTKSDGLRNLSTELW